MPFHRWLPAAMVAPTPVSPRCCTRWRWSKAGVFTMLKVGVYIFGIDFLAATGASVWLMWLAAFSIIAASVVALTKDNLKARLAYSTVSQLSYITLGAWRWRPALWGRWAGACTLSMHAMGKITLFMCAGSNLRRHAQDRHQSQMTGLGPGDADHLHGAFLIGALSIIGLPPLGWIVEQMAADRRGGRHRADG